MARAGRYARRRSRGDVVALVTPWNAVEDALLEAGDFAGKPLLDVTNPIGPGFVLTHGHTTSGGELVASFARNARVVKAFDTTGFENMANPRYGDARLMMPLASDDADALEKAVGLANDLGFEPIPLPALARSREIEPLALLWIKMALQWGTAGTSATRSRGAPWETYDHQSSASDVRRRSRSSAAGHIGGALGRAWLSAGHRVRIATEDAAAEDVARLVSLGAVAVPLAGAGVDADAVVLAIPAGAVLETVARMGDLERKVLVDCTNAIGPGPALLHGLTTSSSEIFAKALPGVRVVRAFNQQGAETLANPVFSGRPALHFVASDDAEASALVRGLSDDVGLDTVDAGPLSSSRYLEPITLLWLAISKALGTRELALSLLRR